MPGCPPGTSPLEGTTHVYKRLSYAGVTLETLSEGVITELHVGLSGTKNQLFPKELANRPRRVSSGA